MGDADELLFVTEGDNAMSVLKPDSARGPQARYADANKFVEENAAARIDRAFWHELKAAPRPPLAVLSYHTRVPVDRGSARLVRITYVRRERLNVANRRIVWKNSQNGRSRKSRFRAPNLICTGNRHDEAHGRATRGKIARAAEPLPNFPSRSSMAVQIVIDAKNRAFHTIDKPDIAGGTVGPRLGEERRKLHPGDCQPTPSPMPGARAWQRARLCRFMSAALHLCIHHT